MAVEFEVSTVLAASPESIYDAWLDSQSHTAMTGGEAQVNNRVGETFTAWNGYIQGRNLILEPHRRIVQAWRTTEFADHEPDSEIEIKLEPEGDGTRLTLSHTNLPPHGGKYAQGWVDAYLEPMAAYFSSLKTQE
jgi:activator of HSP90 ATPase